jgi:hypothetical protein
VVTANALQRSAWVRCQAAAATPASWIGVATWFATARSPSASDYAAVASTAGGVVAAGLGVA